MTPKLILTALGSFLVGYGFNVLGGDYVPPAITWGIHVSSALFLTIAVTAAVPGTISSWHPVLRLLMAIIVFLSVGFPALTLPFWNPLRHATTIDKAKSLRTVYRVEGLASLLSGGVAILAATRPGKVVKTEAE